MAKGSRRSAGKRQRGAGRGESRQPAGDPPAASARAEGAGVQEREETLLLGEPGSIRPLRDLSQPILILHRRWSQEVAPMLLVFFSAFLLYTLTAPRSVTLEDDGLFLMNLEHWGVCHPPGYPLYSLLGSSFYHLMPDFIVPALRGHLFSGFCAAVAAAAVYAIVIQLVRSRLIGVIAGCALAASDVFWSQAIIAEVYTLNAMMYFIVMAMCLRYAGADAREAAGRPHLYLYCAIAFVYGLGLSNHWPLLGLGSIGLLMMVIAQWRNLIARIPFGAVCLCLGLLPYTFLVWRSQTDAALNFYGALDSLEQMRFYVTRGGYSGVDNQSGVGLEEKLAFVRFLSGQFLWQFTPLGLALAVAGFVAMLRSRVHSWLACSLFVSWFMAGPLLIHLIDFQNEFIWFSAFRVYHLLSYGITAIWMAYGLAWLVDLLRARRPQFRLWPQAGVGLGAVVIAATLAAHWHRNDRSDYFWARDLAMYKLGSVEPGTHLFTFDDLDLPVGYLSYVEYVRPDVTVYNDQALVFGNRPYSPFLPDGQKKLVLQKFAEEFNAPIYYHPNRIELFGGPTQGSDFLGFWRRVNRESTDNRVVLSDSLLLWLENALDSSPTISDRWTRQQNYGLIATLTSAVAHAELGGYNLDRRWKEIIGRAYEENPLAHLVMLSARVNSRSFSLEDARREVAWVAQQTADRRDDEQIIDENNISDMLAIAAQIVMRYPEAAPGSPAAYVEEVLRSSVQTRFKVDNVRILVDVLRGQQRHDDAIELLEENLPNISEADAAFRRLHLLLVQERDTGTLQRQVITLPS